MTMKKLSDTYKELGIAFSFPIEIRNPSGKETYYEDSDGFWCKCEYDTEGTVTYREDSDGVKLGTPRSQPSPEERFDWLLSYHNDTIGEKGLMPLSAAIVDAEILSDNK